MTRLGFLIARSFRQENRLQSLSCPTSEIDAALKGKSVALVGNARRPGPPGQGAMIEAADIVIRLNSAPMPSPESHGHRTDILALAVALSNRDLFRIRPGRVLWMSHKRKRLPWSVAQSAGFYLPPLTAFQTIRDSLGAPPSTGLMLIDMLARSNAYQITLYGFDFFSSLSLSGRRTAAQVPHDFSAERLFVEEILARDDRFRMGTAT